jgi:uncharacterized protein YfdQ (DUF2303 family)
MSDELKSSILSTPLHLDSFQAAIEAGKKVVQVIRENDHQLVVTIPQDQRLMAIPREKGEIPRFLTAKPIFNDPAAFIAYVNDFKEKHTRIFYQTEGHFTAVIDYHDPNSAPDSSEGARHGDHLAHLILKRSPEWEAWEKSSGEQMGQQAFAEFIEDHSDDITNPDPSTMLRVASGLHATVGATFKQATNQANGQIQIAYDENINGTVNGKDEQIPSTFQVGLRPFLGGMRYPIDCRLRYRIDRSGGVTLKLHYKALCMEKRTEDALELIIQTVGDKTGIVPALGIHDEKAFKLGTF